MAKAKKLSNTKKKSAAVKKNQITKLKKKPTKKSAVKSKVKSKGKAKKVLPVPKGYHSVIPYLIVTQSAKAIEFYKKAFGAKELFRMEHPNGKISHAELKIGDAKIMLADECHEMNVNSPEKFGGSPVGIHLYIKDVDSVVNRAVATGAKLIRSVETMFYGDRSGTIEDPHGHIWHVSTHVEDVSPAKVRKRAAELFGSK